MVHDVKKEVVAAKRLMDKEVVIDYTNHRGVRGIRYIRPRLVYFGVTEFHQESQWVMSAYDMTKQAERTFAMKDIHSWTPAEKYKPADAGSYWDSIGTAQG